MRNWLFFIGFIGFVTTLSSCVVRREGMVYEHYEKSGNFTVRPDKPQENLKGKRIQYRVIKE